MRHCLSVEGGSLASSSEEYLDVRRFSATCPESLKTLMPFIWARGVARGYTLDIFKELEEGEVLVVEMLESSYLAEAEGNTCFSTLYICNLADETEFTTKVYNRVFSGFLSTTGCLTRMRWRFYKFQKLQLVPYVEEGLF